MITKTSKERVDWRRIIDLLASQGATLSDFFRVKKKLFRFYNQKHENLKASNSVKVNQTSEEKLSASKSQILVFRESSAF